MTFSPPSDRRRSASPGADEPASLPVDRDDTELLRATKQSNRIMSGVLIILVGGAFYTAAAFFMPVVLALLLALTLSPLVRSLHRKGLGEGLAAGLVVLLFALGIAGAFAALGTPFFDLVDDAPRMVAEVREKYEQIRDPLSSVTSVADQVDPAFSR